MFEWYHQARKDQFEDLEGMNTLISEEEGTTMADWYEHDAELRARTDYDRTPLFATDPREKYLDKKWDMRFLRMARDSFMTWSKDPSTKIGAVAVDPSTRAVLAGGYNGFPRKILDLAERLEDRGQKYNHMIHAEMNVICNAALTGVSLRDSVLYVYGLPICVACCPVVIQVGFSHAVECYPADLSGKWSEEGEISLRMFREAGIGRRYYDPEEIDE